MNLQRRLIQRIDAVGPITVADYIDACLNDARGGYYATRPILGPGGDFITAPLVSQMFGELIGAWAAEVWRRLGTPGRVRLVELGPGDGTMMVDVLRAAATWPGFAGAIDLILVETSGPLRALQADRLGARQAERTRWVGDIGEIGEGPPMVVVANEFLDCLPVRQAVRVGGVWRERRIGVGPAGDLEFAAGEALDLGDCAGKAGDIIEFSPARAAFAAQVGDILLRDGGAALFVDYATDGRGDSLQAIRGHRRVSPFAHPGQADLTARVDFAAFLAAVTPAAGFGPVSQAAFLLRLGLEARAAALARVHPNRAAKIARQVRRLVSSRQMGELFQVAGVAAPGLAPPGFETAGSK